MNNIALGRYLPYDSIIHRLDPRVKIIALILLMVATFIPHGFIGYAIIAALIIITTYLAKLTITFLLRSLKPMIFMMILLCFFNIIFMKQGKLLFEWGFISIYSEAILQTLYLIIRLTFIIMLTTLLTSTTKPLDLTMGIESLIKPLKVIHVPAEEIAMIISIALRFIPTLIEETQRIMKAQASRGVDLNEGKLMAKIQAVLSMIVPLFASAFQRAIDLSYAMETRGYVPNKPRTKYRQLKLRLADFIALFISLAILIGIIILNIYG